MDLVGWNAVVIGGASGIGSGLCRALASDGAAVNVCDIDLSGAEQLAAELRRSGADIAVHEIDVTSPDKLICAEHSIRERRGRIDLVFANAGAICLKMFVDATPQDWEWLVRVNLFGTVNSIRAFLPGMLAQESRSRIAVTSSVAALRTSEMMGQTLYMATKAAQLGLCNALFNELQGTTVDLSIIFPGPVSTRLREKSEKARPGAIQTAVPEGAVGIGRITPEAAGRLIVDAVKRGQRYISPHPTEGARVRKIQDEIMTAFAGP